MFCNIVEEAEKKFPFEQQLQKGLKVLMEGEVNASMKSVTFNGSMSFHFSPVACYQMI